MSYQLRFRRRLAAASALIVAAGVMTASGAAAEPGDTIQPSAGVIGDQTVGFTDQPVLVTGTGAVEGTESGGTTTIAVTIDGVGETCAVAGPLDVAGTWSCEVSGDLEPDTYTVRASAFDSNPNNLDPQSEESVGTLEITEDRPSKPQGCAEYDDSAYNAPRTDGRSVFTVASYNITGQNTTGGTAPWADRRQGVADTIVGCMPDILGLQEASAGYVTEGGVKKNMSQYEDLIDILDSELEDFGDRYVVTNTERSSCSSDPLNTGCTPDSNPSDGPSGSNDTRIIYNKAKVQVLKEGFKKLPGVESYGPSKYRYVAWAQFQDLATNQTLFYATTHLEYNHPSGKTAANTLRRDEMTAIVVEIKSKNTDKDPVVVTGDMNSSSYEYLTTAVDQAATSSQKLSDVIGHDRITKNTKTKKRGSCKVKTANYRVPYLESARINPGYSTSTNSVPSLSATSACLVKLEKAKWWKVNGAAIDYILTNTDTIRPKTYETVVDPNSKGGYAGEPPSDHNMIMSSLVLLK